MDAAEKYKNRHRAVIEYANGAMFNIAELDAWAIANKSPLSFERLFAHSDKTVDYAPERHYVSFEILAHTIAWNFVPEDTSPDEARQQLKAAHDRATPDDPVSRLRDLVMVRYNNELLSAVYDGNLNLFDTLTYGKIDVEAARLGYNENPNAFLEDSRARVNGRRPVAVQQELTHVGAVPKDDTTAGIMDGGATWVPDVVASIAERATCWEHSQPAPLCGEGYSEEMRKETTLTKYLVFDTWPPAAAAMLVCGLQALIVDGLLGTEIPAGRVKGLDDDWKSEQNCTAIADAKRVLGIWLSRENPPAKVRPLDFIAWCKTKGINTAWLSSIEDQAAVADLPRTRDQASTTTLEAALPPPDQLLTLDELATAICPGDAFDKARWMLDIRRACSGDLPALIARYADGREVEPGTAGAQHALGTHILSRDAAKWLKSKGWTVKHEQQPQVEQPSQSQVSEKTPAPAADVEQRRETGVQEKTWKEWARTYADEFFDHDTQQGTRDSLDGYSKRVMGKMQEQQKHGPRGRITNHATIKREALQGANWWQKKNK